MFFTFDFEWTFLLRKKRDIFFTKVNKITNDLLARIIKAIFWKLCCYWIFHQLLFFSSRYLTPIFSPSLSRSWPRAKTKQERKRPGLSSTLHPRAPRTKFAIWSSSMWSHLCAICSQSLTPKWSRLHWTAWKTFWSWDIRIRDSTARLIHTRSRSRSVVAWIRSNSYKAIRTKRFTRRLFRLLRLTSVRKKKILDWCLKWAAFFIQIILIGPPKIVTSYTKIIMCVQKWMNWHYYNLNDPIIG